MKSIKFFLLVFILSIPFWILGAAAPELTRSLPVKLPISALMAICPALAALLLVNKESGPRGVKELVRGVFDHEKIKDKKWYLLIIFLMPAITLLSYWAMQLARMPLPATRTPLVAALLFFFVFFIGAIGEEIGWTGYVLDPLQHRWGALKASIILGIIWAIWHIIPYTQIPQPATWIVWQCVSTVLLRIVMVWIYNSAGKSVFAAVLFHAMIDTSTFLYPRYGSHYNPLVGATFLLLTVGIVGLFWKRFRPQPGPYEPLPARGCETTT
ncbi:type II CAAX endopeptidase family protein [Hymenobacter sp.]|uniref:CPBP family intramembrane glutamic endopeptidase n=1 Tax=Hymenobacter sp. TaxID=1898978 RepID=UPI00286CE90B|nr:type II CAAX endopeptidase family protein [Hymenobacter sp.]